MLELDNVSKRVGASLHIDAATLTLERGTVNVLLGPTLAGKTTLMRLMAGLDKPTRGDIRFDGRSVVGVPVRRRNVAMVYQQFINYPAFTVYENIASPMRLSGVDKATLDKRVREAAELLKLTDFLDRTPLNLSGGQQQRTAIARALVKRAELVLLDEPLANLDYKLREELRVELPRIFSETGAIFVYATTEPHEALLLGGNTATLSEGRITQFDRTIDVYKRPVDLRTAQTFADPPLNEAAVTSTAGQLRFSNHDIGQPSTPVPDGQYTVAMRAHHLSLAQDEKHTVALPAIVGTSEITGSETFIHVHVGEGENKSHWVVLSHGVHRLHSGENITVYLDPSRYFVFDSNSKLVVAPTVAAEAA